MKTDLQPKQTAEKETSLSVNEVSAKEQNQIILYHPNDTISLEVRLENDTVWLSQAQMTELFGSTKQNISLHINNIFKEGELKQNSVVKDFLTTASDGKNYNVLHYNLDAIIAVGYRINSKKATEFRIWKN